MAVGHQDHGRVAVAIRLSLAVSVSRAISASVKILPRPQFGVRSAHRHGNCSFFGGWRYQFEMRLGHDFAPSANGLFDNSHLSNSRKGRDAPIKRADYRLRRLALNSASARSASVPGSLWPHRIGPDDGGVCGGEGLDLLAQLVEHANAAAGEFIAESSFSITSSLLVQASNSPTPPTSSSRSSMNPSSFAFNAAAEPAAPHCRSPVAPVKTSSSWADSVSIVTLVLLAVGSTSSAILAWMLSPSSLAAQASADRSSVLNPASL